MSTTKTKEYIRPMPATWWLHNRHLVMFMVRELTAVFVGGYAIFLIVLLGLTLKSMQTADAEIKAAVALGNEKEVSKEKIAAMNSRAPEQRGLEFKHMVTDVLMSPWAIVLQGIALIFMLYHTFTWFNLTPKALVVYRGEERVSPILIAGSNYVLWILVSVGLFYLTTNIKTQGAVVKPPANGGQNGPPPDDPNVKPPANGGVHGPIQ